MYSSLLIFPNECYTELNPHVQLGSQRLGQDLCSISPHLPPTSSIEEQVPHLYVQELRVFLSITLQKHISRTGLNFLTLCKKSLQLFLYYFAFKEKFPLGENYIIIQFPGCNDDSDNCQALTPCLLSVDLSFTDDTNLSSELPDQS